MFKKTTKTIFLCVLILSGFARADTVAIKAFPAPETVSAEMRPFVSAPPLAFWNEHPKSDQEWREWVEKLAQKTRKKLPQLKARMQVSVEKQYFAGVPGFVVTPNQTAPENSHRVLLHFHGGGYVLNPGEAGIDEAIMMAGYGHIKVISIDYRMPPDFPFPAAIDDAVAAYKEIAKRYAPKDIGVFGTSTGGGITLALMLSIKEQGLPMPAAIALGTPWSDLSNTGDSYLTNEGVDNVLVSYSGWLGDAAKLYANGLDLKTPLLSPIYGDVQGLPPTLLVTGTRDLFLSNTVRMHLKLRQSGVIADLVVLEGLSHAQYLMAIDAPENQLYFLQYAQFFNRYLSQ